MNKEITQSDLLKKYLGEILREFFDFGTPIYYRVHLSNPKSILKEVLDYIDLNKNTPNLNYSHVKRMLNEYLLHSKRDVIFKQYGDTFKNFNLFVEQNFKKDECEDKLFKNNIETLLIRISPILRNLNDSYFEKCRSSLKDIFEKPETSIEPIDFIKLKKICFSLSTEILRRGYSKPFIYDKVYENLLNKPVVTYQDIQNFLENFMNKEDSVCVYLRIYSSNPEIFKILESIHESNTLKSFNLGSGKSLGIKPHLENLYTGFKAKTPKHFWLKKKVKALDFTQAARKFVSEVNSYLDEINYEYPRDRFSIHHHALVIGESGKAEIPVISEQIDGHRQKSSIAFFTSKKEKISKIMTSEQVTPATKDKIKTLLRFYRYFCEANTLEHKFLNLWIGWEHVFSLDMSKESFTWKNIYTLFPKIHSLYYTEDVLKDLLHSQLHRNCGKNGSGMKMKKKIWKNIDNIFSEKPQEQTANLYSAIKTKDDSWDELFNLESLKNDDLTKVKIFRLNRRFNEPIKFIREHRNKVEWDLFRLYRVRNTLIHKGSIEKLDVPLEILTAQLESFYKEVLNIILDRFSVNQRFSSIEQLFYAHQVTYDDLISEKEINKLIDPVLIKKKILTPPLRF